MSSFMTEWRRTFSAGDVALVPPQGPEVGIIRVRQHLPGRPALKKIVAAVHAESPGATVEGPLLLVTAEGELGAVVNLVEERRQRTTAVIFGDDFYAQIDGKVHQREHFAVFRQAVAKLAHGHCMGLGTDRWRRFYYEPPPGWTGVARPRETLWIAPSCPRTHQIIRVYDARPPRAGLAERQRRQLIESVAAEVGAERPAAAPPFRTRDGLPAEMLTYRGELPGRGRVKVSDAMVLEPRYLYRFRLECDEAAHEAAMGVFHGLITSMRPVPARKPDADVLSTWQD